MKLQKIIRNIHRGAVIGVVVAMACLFGGNLTAKAAVLGLDRASYGVFDRGGDNEKTTYPFLNGTEFTSGWEALNTGPGIYDWSTLDAALQAAYDNNQPIVVRFLPVGLSWSAPLWLNTVLGLDRFTDGTYFYSYYLDPVYKTSFSNMVVALGNHLRSEIDPKLLNNIACVRVEIGATSDPNPYNAPVPSQYAITWPEWQTFSEWAFAVHIQAFQTGAGRKLPLRFSTDEGLTPDLWDWCLAHTLPGLRGNKYAGSVRGHHLTGSGSQVAELKPLQVDSTNGIFSINEMDKTWQNPYFQLNVRLGFYWCAVEQLNGGLSIWDVDSSSLRNTYIDNTDFAFTLFNTWAAELVPTTARGGFCIFHEGLDSSDTVKFPEATYGSASKGNTNRYTAICAPYASRGARMDDLTSATKGQVYQRANQTGFNDAGWDIVSGNYERFITQINPDTTSLALWRVRGTLTNSSHPFDRFARRFDRASGKNAMRFNVHDGLTPTPGQSIQLSVIYLDSGTNRFGLIYDAVGNSQKSAFTVTKANSNTWKTNTVTVTDWVFGNNGPNGSDLVLTNLDSSGDTTFHGIELVKRVDVTMNTVGQGTVSARNEATVYSPVTGTYATGQRLEMMVTPASGWEFSSWSGDLSGSNSRAFLFPTNVNTQVTANFIPATEAVPWVEDFQSQAAGATSDGPPTSWTATPTNGSFRVLSGEMAFNNVGSDGVFTTGAINISSGPVMVSLQVRGGSGLDVGQDFLRFYKKVDGGAEVQIAAADGPQAAATWTGSVPTGSNLVLVIRAHVTATSEYYYFDNLQVTNLPVTVPTYTLSQSATNGTITLNPPGGVYTNGAVITVTAVANSGYTFVSWSGNLTGAVNPTNLTMNGNQSVTANFVSIPTYTLATSATNGSITLNPPGGAYSTGTIITNTAMPNPGYSFAGWSGSLTGSTNPAVIVMDGNKTITANFTPIPIVLVMNPTGPGAGFEISASNLSPAWVYELQGKTSLTSPWNTISLQSNVTVAVWSIIHSPAEPAKFFRVIKHD